MSKFNITNIPTVTAFKLNADSAIIHVQYNTRYELCSSFMRLHEYYESADPQIQGHYFTIEEYMDSYAKANGGFSYTMDWSGFNIPHNVYHEFCDLFESHGFNKKETTLIHEINRVLDDMTMTIDNLMNLKFYIIGSYKECPREANVVQHEIAHALYSIDSDYKYHADVNCNVIPFRDEMIEVLKEWGMPILSSKMNYRLMLQQIVKLIGNHFHA